MRVWIEMFSGGDLVVNGIVTLCVRVWIEMDKSALLSVRLPSHPLREGVD